MSLLQKSRRTWLTRLLAMGAAATVLAGCLAPTLPMPPPGRPVVSAPNEDGMINISGVVNAHARVFVQNERSGDIVGRRTEESGRYEVQMQAEVGDILLVWQTVNTLESQIREVIVPPTDQLDLGTPAPSGAAGASGK